MTKTMKRPFRIVGTCWLCEPDIFGM